MTGSGVVDLDADTENGGVSSAPPHAGCQDQGSSSHEPTTSTESSDTSCDECDRRLPREVPAAPPGLQVTACGSTRGLECFTLQRRITFAYLRVAGR